MTAQTTQRGLTEGLAGAMRKAEYWGHR